MALKPIGKYLSFFFFFLNDYSTYVLRVVGFLEGSEGLEFCAHTCAMEQTGLSLEDSCRGRPFSPGIGIVLSTGVSEGIDLSK